MSLDMSLIMGTAKGLSFVTSNVRGGSIFILDNIMTNLLPPGVPERKKQKQKQVSARKKMSRRGYDPIDALVDTHERLLEDDEYWRAVRDGTLVPVRGQKVVRYSAVAHAAVQAQLVKIGHELLRYGYARVPENVDQAPERLPNFTVNLSNGGTHVINGESRVIEDEDDDE